MNSKRLQTGCSETDAGRRYIPPAPSPSPAQRAWKQNPTEKIKHLHLDILHIFHPPLSLWILMFIYSELLTFLLFWNFDFHAWILIENVFFLLWFKFSLISSEFWIIFLWSFLFYYEPVDLINVMFMLWCCVFVRGKLVSVNTLKVFVHRFSFRRAKVQIISRSYPYDSFPLILFLWSRYLLLLQI